MRKSNYDEVKKMEASFGYHNQVFVLYP